MNDDIVRAILELARAADPKTAAEWVALERQVRDEWGGCRPYIAKEPLQKKRLVIGARIAAGGTVEEARREARVSHAWVYRILGQRTRRLV